MKKFTIISLVSVILIIPISFGVYTEGFIARELKLLVIFVLIINMFVFILIGKIINLFGFDKKNIDLMKHHKVIDAFIYDDIKLLWVFFPLTMIMEELIFRYYLISFLFSTLQLKIIFSILLSSLLFSLYHFHTWFSFKNITILLIILGYTIILGLFNGYIFITLGIIPCIIIHYGMAFFLHYDLYRKYYSPDVSKFEKN